MSDNRILLTGATGFLGSAVARQSIGAGFSITAMGRTTSKRSPYFDFISADILDPLSLAKACKGVDCVCHVAGLAHIFNNPNALAAKFHAVNVVGSENVAYAAVRAGVRYFVFISSVSVYGGVSNGKDEESACHPEGPYAESKWQAERCLIELCRKEGMNLTILRLATLYGEEDLGNVARLIRSIERGRFVWIGKGMNLKSLLHREDAARACIAVIKAPALGINIYNVSAPPRTMHAIVETIGCALGKTVPSWHIPASFALNSAKIIKTLSFNRGRFSTIYGTLNKWLADDYYNVDKLCSTFNFQTKVSLEDGIQLEVAWYKAKISE